MIELPQFIIPPTSESDGSTLEHDIDKKEADEGDEKEGSLSVNSKAGKEREENLSDANTEYQKDKVQPASFLVKNAVIILK